MGIQEHPMSGDGLLTCHRWFRLLEKPRESTRRHSHSEQLSRHGSTRHHGSFDSLSSAIPLGYSSEMPACAITCWGPMRALYLTNVERVKRKNERRSGAAPVGRDEAHFVPEPPPKRLFPFLWNLFLGYGYVIRPRMGKRG